jgi:GntR family carbon starvation induced transcriptional regulator
MLESIGQEETQARIAADRLVADIRTGTLEPGRKLRVEELKKRYGFGASPLREALLLLTSQGYVTGESYRGYRVAQMSFEDLADITLAREVVETAMLRRSLEIRSDEWAVGVVAALERLRLVVQKSPVDSIDGVTPTGLAHKHFHLALVAGCLSPRLLSSQRLLYDQASRYRDVMVQEIKSPEHFVEIHAELAHTVLKADVEPACQALRDHLNLTPRDVYGATLHDRGHDRGSGIGDSKASPLRKASVRPHDRPATSGAVCAQVSSDDDRPVSLRVGADWAATE